MLLCKEPVFAAVTVFIRHIASPTRGVDAAFCNQTFDHIS